MTVINTDNNQIMREVLVGSPVYIAVGPDGLSGYAANFDDGTVSVIDAEDKQAIFVGDGPSDVEVSADGTQVYVPNLGSNTVPVATVTSSQSV